MSETVAGDEEGGRGPRRTWSEEKKDAFIEVLAETCNVRLACDAAGMGTGPAYALKMRDAGFAERWQQALAVGYARVEERLIRDAMGEAGDGEAGSAPMSKYDRELALNLLKFHHGEVGWPHRGGTTPKRASEAETDAEILARLAAVKKRLGL